MIRVIDTDSEPGAYADALRFPPFIEDREGFCFFNLSFLSPDTGFERVPDAGEGSANAAPFADVPTFHDTPISSEAQHDHD